MRGEKKGDTLCWSCDVSGTSRCSWDRCLKPVEGWLAEMVPYRCLQGKMSYTYCVLECPLYEKHDGYYVEVGGQKPRVTDEMIYNLSKSGWTDRSIANRFCVATSMIRRRKEKIFSRMSEQWGDKNDRS